VIEAVGVSEFIRGRLARFLEELEGEDLQVLRPEEAQLTPDTSSGYVHSLLFVESCLRQTVPDDSRIYLGRQAAPAVMVLAKSHDPKEGAAHLIGQVLDVPGLPLGRLLDGLEALAVLR
jgi:hypothetical protein